MQIIKGYRSGTGGSLYVHVPFCMRKCAYCDFYSVPMADGTARAWLNALGHEARFLGPGPAQTIYVGGGTPTALSQSMLSDLMALVVEAAQPLSGAEFTVEANPGTLDERKLLILRDAGVTRVSLGVQSLGDRELRALGRAHTAREAIDSARLIKEAGFALSLDLMYGIPEQGMGEWRQTLRALMALRPDHVSAYELTPAEGTPIWDGIEAGLLALPDEDLVTQMFFHCRETLLGEGYRHYELSNYALPGQECRHNQNYWRRGTFIGLGPGAHSFDGAARWWNIEDVDAYVRMLSEGLSPVAERHELSPEDALREEVMLGLRTLDGLDIARFQARHGLDLMAACGELIKDGLLEERQGMISLTPRGLMLMNPVTVRVFIGLNL